MLYKCDFNNSLGGFHRKVIPRRKSSQTIAQSCVSSGTKLTAQFPSHGLGEPVAYRFQTLANDAALLCSRKHYEILPPRPGFEP